MNPQQINNAANIGHISAPNQSPNHGSLTANELNSRNAGRTFGDVLLQAVDDSGKLRFSKHAALRLNSREVDLTPEQIKRVEEGVNKAIIKGVSDSLVLVDGFALVVNTRSRTVVTAMDSRQRTDGVFTNIDGAVIV